MHMQLIRLKYPLTDTTHLPTSGQAIAIGDFDGVHRGHRSVIARAAKHARTRGIPLSIMTFDPHPREILGKPQYTRYLTPLREKMRQFEMLGVDYVYVVEFTEELAKVPPQPYFEHMLKPLNPESIIVGFDFTFGYKGQGTADTLMRLAGEDVSVDVVAPYQMDGEKVSSTLIREQLHLGRLDRVLHLLGRNYHIEGKVVPGEGRGRTIGFPTANLELSDRYVVPRQGVYAVRVLDGDETWNGVMNIGIKPTFHPDEEQPPTLEVHVLDFDSDLYDRNLTIEFVTYLRPEMKFPSVQELIAQIAKDAEQARQILA